jgi:hypothetical protein
MNAPKEDCCHLLMSLHLESTQASGNYTIDDMTPLFADLTGSLDAAAASLATISPITVVRSLASRQTNDELANLIAGIVNDIADALQGLVGDLATIPLLAGLLAGVDTSLNQVCVRLYGHSYKCLTTLKDSHWSRHSLERCLEPRR